MTDLDLATRTGLPDPLRVLVALYPRLGWETHPHFTMLTRFWLDRHLGFRQMQAMLVVETRAFLTRDRAPEVYADRLLSVAGQLLSELHGHHRIEDEHYFPILLTLDARIADGFALLDADHQALDGAIHALAAAANAVLGGIAEHRPAERDADALAVELDRFGRLIDRHLTDEEELVVPVILDHPEAGLG